MATKTSKRAGETSTTVSVGIRIDPKIKFALDIMGRLQKRSLTAVIEWAISQAITNQQLDSEGGTLSSAIDKVWSTDESVRLVKLAYHMPEALTYDELRIWETIKATGYFWHKSKAGDYNPETGELSVFLVTDNWETILQHVERHKGSSTIVPLSDADLIPF